MSPSVELSIEQDFRLKVFTDYLQNLSRDEVQALVVELYRNSMVQEQLFKQIMGEYLGLCREMTA